jgi:glycosyltransferase involved in cell wall biosynthesis
MKILLAADIFPPQTGGPATYVVTLANELTKRGDKVSIVSLNSNSDKSVVRCLLFVVCWKGKTLRYLHYLWLLLKHAKNCDVIYAMGPVNSGLPALIAGRLRRKKVVVKVVGDYAWEQGVQRFGVKNDIESFQKEKNLPWQVKHLRNIERYVVCKSDMVIVPSKYLKRLITDWGCGWHHVQVVCNAVQLMKVEAIKKPDTERWIVSVARLVPWKGIKTLIEVIAELKIKIPQIKLKIIGSGPEQDKLNLQVTGDQLQDCVEFLGTLPKKEVYSYLKSADIFVLNSAYEGLSHVLIEAIQSQCPVLASNVGGNPELIQEGENGGLFEYNNKEEIKEKIQWALVNATPAWSKKVSEKFRKDFSLDKMIQETIEVFNVITKKTL